MIGFIQLLLGKGVQHLHFHLIPRFIANPATKPWSVSDHYWSIDSDQSRQVCQDHLNDFVIKVREIKGGQFCITHEYLYAKIVHSLLQSLQ